MNTRPRHATGKHRKQSTPILTRVITALKPKPKTDITEDTVLLPRITT